MPFDASQRVAHADDQGWDLKWYCCSAQSGLEPPWVRNATRDCGRIRVVLPYDVAIVVMTARNSLDRDISPGANQTSEELSCDRSSFSPLTFIRSSNSQVLAQIVSPHGTFWKVS